MQRWRGTTITIIGAILVCFTLIAFFLLNIERTALYLSALIFLIVAEVVFFVGLSATKSLDTNNHNKVFVKSGISVILSLYLLATFISTLFAARFKHMLNTFILLELALIVLVAVIVLIILAFSRRISHNDQKIVDDGSFIGTCEKRAYNLLSNATNKWYKYELNRLYESLKYSDKITPSSVDDKIEAQITILENILISEELEKQELRKLFAEISASVNQRKAELSQLKRGGF